MACQECLTANEILDGARMIDQWCAKKVDRFNRILRNFYLDTVGVQYNIVAQPIGANGLTTIQTEYPIYKIFWFFWEWCDPCFIDEGNKCCGQWTNFLKMYQVDRDPKVGQYKYECSTEIKANIPNWLKNWYFVYSRWPSEIEWMNEEVCINPMMQTGLEYMIEKFYGELDDDNNAREIARQNYTEWLADIKKASDTVTFSIELGVNANSPRD